MQCREPKKVRKRLQFYRRRQGFAPQEVIILYMVECIACLSHSVYVGKDSVCKHWKLLFVTSAQAKTTLNKKIIKITIQLNREGGHSGKSFLAYLQYIYFLQVNHVTSSLQNI